MQSLRTIVQKPYLHVIGLYKQGHAKISSYLVVLGTLGK